jgi:hypothetical protein
VTDDAPFVSKTSMASLAPHAGSFSPPAQVPINEDVKAILSVLVGACLLVALAIVTLIARPDGDGCDDES